MFLTLVGSLVGNWLITQANDRTKAALNEAQLRAEEAEKRFQQARQAADLLIEVSEQELADTPSDPGPAQATPGNGARLLSGLHRQHRGNASSQAELIAVQDRLKKILDDLIRLGGAGQLILLSDRQVQADLALNDAQRQQIEALTAEFAQRRLDSLHDFFQPSSPDGQIAVPGTGAGQRSRHAGHAHAGATPTVGTNHPAIPRSHGFRRTPDVAQLRLTEAQRQAIRQIGMDRLRPLGIR